MKLCLSFSDNLSMSRETKTHAQVLPVYFGDGAGEGCSGFICSLFDGHKNKVGMSLDGGP